MTVQSGRVIQSTYAIQHLLIHVTPQTFPLFTWIIQHVMHLHSGFELLDLFLQDYILFCFVSEEQDHLNCLIFHFEDFWDGLVYGCDSSSTTDEKYPILEDLFAINKNSIARLVAKPTKWPINVYLVSYFQFLKVGCQFAAMWKGRVLSRSIDL